MEDLHVHVIEEESFDNVVVLVLFCHDFQESSSVFFSKLDGPVKVLEVERTSFIACPSAEFIEIGCAVHGFCSVFKFLRSIF